MLSSGMLRRVALVRTNVSGERIEEMYTQRLLVTANFHSCHPDDGGDAYIQNIGSYKSHTA
jgi:hypothetical protein